MDNTFLQPDNKMLYEKAKTVKKSDFGTDLFLEIINKMKEAAGANQHKNKKIPIMVGLAAPQIGYSYKIIFVDVSATGNRDNKYGDNIFMVNPKIISRSSKTSKGREGCYSTKMVGCDIRGVVERSTSVRVKYLTENGEPKEEDFFGFTAVIIQHEVDHLEGKVFVHRITKEKDLHLVFPSENLLYKKNYKKWKRNISSDLYFKDICKM